MTAGPEHEAAALPSGTMPMVRAEQVRKRFGRHEVLKGVDLDVAAGQVCCIIGPSGSGKSTLLRCVNHLEKIDAGLLWVDGDLIGYRQRGGKLYEMKPSEVAAQRRDIGMVFQQFNLFPHMTALTTSWRRRSASTASPGPPPARTR